MVVAANNRMLVEDIKLAFSKLSLVSHSVQMGLKALFALELLPTMIFANHGIIVKDSHVSF